MSIYAKAPEQKERVIVPAGNYIARCFSMVYLGTFRKEYQGKETLAQKVQIAWELPTQMIEFEKDGEKKSAPLSVGREFTLSMSEKGNLRPILETWRGRTFTEEEAKSFDITKVIGVPCMLNIIHKNSKATGKPYPFVASVAPMPQGIICPNAINPPFELAPEDWDGPKMEQVPNFLKEKIAESEEWKARSVEQMAPAETGAQKAPEEEIPTINLDDEKEIRIEDVPF